MYTLELYHYFTNAYHEIKAETIEECFRIAHAKGYKESNYEFYCNGIKE